MTIETLEKRIAGKEKAIATLEKKIQRIEAAKATNWEKNPYWYNERDLECSQRDLESEKKALAKYQEQLAQEIEKTNSRDVEVIMNFLETWKVTVIDWFKDEKARYDIALKEYYAKNSELCNRYNDRRRLGLTSEEIKAIDEEMSYLRKQFKNDWSHVMQFSHGDRTWEENLERDIEIEKNRKYDDIIERTNSIVGEITDASGLRVGAKGDLNGIIVGTRGTAKVQTIGAGGYHIQCYHFRTLIHEVK